jgi:dTMP kinase
MKSIVRSRFITLEGGEGAGKSTQTRLLAAWLAGRGIDVLTTREPGGTPSAEDIRGLLVSGETRRWDPITETLLHYAARREHVVRCIAPALAAGKWVICDRFFDSTLAYQGYGQGVALELIDRIRALAIGEFAPDLTLLLDVGTRTGLARTAARPGAEDRYERMNEDFHLRVRDGFAAIAASEPYRCAVIPADGGVEEVARAIQKAVIERFDFTVGPVLST